MNVNYLALAKGLNRRELVPVTYDYHSIIKKNPRQDYYISLFKYNDNHLELFKKTGSLKGIKDVTTNKLVFDFDNELDLDQARKDTLEIFARLVKAGVAEDHIRLYFSGNKGFGVEVITDTEMTRQEFVNIVFGLAGDLSTFDTRINDEQRIIRAPLSRHPESNLYKIPLTLHELATKTIETIREEAKDATAYEFDPDEVYQIALTKELHVLKSTNYKKVGVVTSLDDIKNFDIKDIDFTRCPKWMTKERFALQEGFFFGSESVAKGERNAAFMIMAATYKNQGFSADHALGLLLAMAQKQAKRTGETEITEDQLKHEVINSVYHPGWQGGIYGSDEEILQITRKRFGLNDVVIDKPNLVKIDDVAARFKEFARTFDQNRIMTGIKPVDDAVILTSGMMVGLLGSPGSGKTSIANAIVEHLSKANTPVIYESLDMYDNLLYTRLLQKYVPYDMKKIIDMFRDNTPDEALVNAYSQVIKNYSNVEFNFRSGPSLEDIEKDVVDYIQYNGKSPRLLIVDYLEKVRGPFADATANSAYVASRLSDIAKKYDLMVLVLLQPQKSAGDPREELLSMRKIKGASVIEQDCRVVLTSWRPGYDPQDSSDDNFMSIGVVKNNMGGLCQVDLAWNGLQGSLRELESNEKADLKSLKHRLEEIRAHRDDI